MRTEFHKDQLKNFQRYKLFCKKYKIANIYKQSILGKNAFKILFLI